MNENILLLVLSLFFIGCTSKSSSEKVDSDQSSTISKASFLQTKMISLDSYKTATVNSSDISPVDRLCKESKGYNKNEWEGINECSWAVEKFQLEQHSNLVKRSGHQLILELADGPKTFSHSFDEGEPRTFYQFKNHHDKANLFCIAKYIENSCPQYLLIQKNNGHTESYDGLPVFNSNQDAFLLSTASKSISSCKNELQYWKITDGKAAKVWSGPSTQATYDLVFSANQWQGRLADGKATAITLTK